MRVGDVPAPESVSRTVLMVDDDPDVNWFFTSLEGQPREDFRDDVRTYLDANPTVKADLTGIRQPLVDLKNRCGSAPAPSIP